MSYAWKFLLDKMALTVPIPLDSWNDARNGLFYALHEEPEFFRSVAGGVEEEGFRPYQFALMLELPANNEISTCRIEFGPTKPSIAFMRLVWNPSNAPFRLAPRIVEKLAPYIPHLQDVWPLSTITRVDITFDVRHRHITQFYVLTKSARSIYEPRFENSGRLNSFYLGAARSKHKALVYDRRFKIMGSRRLSPPKGFGRAPFLEPEWTRFEFRFKLGRLQEIQSVKNGLLNYIVAETWIAHKLHLGRHWNQLLRLCDECGAQEVFRRYLNQRQRAYFRRIFERRCTPAWFSNKDALWSNAIAEIQRELSL